MTLGHTSDFQPMTLLSVLTVLDIWSQLTFLVKTEIWRKKKKQNNNNNNSLDQLFPLLSYY